MTTRTQCVRCRFALEQIQAPKAVFVMTDEGEPGGPAAIRRRMVVAGQNPADHILINRYIEGECDLLRIAWVAPTRITPLHFDDSLDELFLRSLRAGSASPFGQEQKAIFPLDQRAVELKRSGRLYDVCGASNTCRTHQRRGQTCDDPIRRAQIGRGAPRPRPSRR